MSGSWKSQNRPLNCLEQQKCKDFFVNIYLLLVLLPSIEMNEISAGLAASRPPPGPSPPPPGPVSPFPPRSPLPTRPLPLPTPPLPLPTPPLPRPTPCFPTTTPTPPIAITILSSTSLKTLSAINTTHGRLQSNPPLRHSELR